MNVIFTYKNDNRQAHPGQLLKASSSPKLSPASILSLPPCCVCVQVVKLGDSRVIETLLQAGANPNVPDPSCGLTVTHDAAREGFVDSVRVLLNYGADVNIADERGTELNDLIYFCFVFFSHLVLIDL